MQERGFRDSDLFDIDIISTSDIDKEAILSYAAIHCGLTNDMIDTYESYPAKEIMIKELIEKNIGYDFKKKEMYDWGKLGRRKGKKVEKYWLAMILANNVGDICKVKELPYCDLLTFSFPCQSISIAGKQEGIIQGETRSGLVYEVTRLVQAAKDNNTLPKYMMLENVSALVNKKFIDDFNNLNLFFDNIGYKVYWSLINGKDCGIPQNRNRCFAIYIRKDIDTGLMNFPIPFDNGLRLKDALEDKVSDKYYLSETAMKKFKLFSKSKGTDIKVAGSLNPEKNVQDRVRVLDSDGISQGLRATDYKDPVKIVTGIDKSNKNPREIEYANCITAREDRGISNRKAEGTAILEQLGQIYGTDKEPNPQAGRVYNSDCLSPTLDTCQGGNRMPKIIQVGQVSNDGSQAGKVYSTDGVSQTICAGTHGYAMGNIYDDIRIRKLTPRECYKLMGLTFEDCDKATSIGVADTHLYKQAGNGIITNCAELIAEHLYKAQYDNTYRCFDENFIRPQME